MSERELQPRDRCPTCGGAVEQASDEPLEEFGIGPGCGYYRAEVINGEVVEDVC